MRQNKFNYSAFFSKCFCKMMPRCAYWLTTLTSVGYLFSFSRADRIWFSGLPVAHGGRFPSCCAEDMCRLPVALLFICFWLAERSHCDGSLQNSMGELHARFAVSLYQALTETENNSNLITSPLSVSVSLGLLQLGARGNTLAQLEGTLGYNVNGTFHLGIFGIRR